MHKRLLAVILALILILCAGSAAAFADETESDSFPADEVQMQVETQDEEDPAAAADTVISEAAPEDTDDLTAVTDLADTLPAVNPDDQAAEIPDEFPAVDENEAVLTDTVEETAEEAVVDANDAVTQFLTRLYKNFLRRNPDNAGLKSWRTALLNGTTTGAKTVYGFVYSNEFQSNPLSDTDYIKALYTSVLGRSADSSGLNNWLSKLQNGCTRKKVLEGFLNSAEMSRLCSSMGVKAGSYKSDNIADQNEQAAAFVARMYTKCLNRSYDRSGLDNWVKQLVNGSKTGDDIVRGFFLSAELGSRGLSNLTFVQTVYQALFNRSADATGLNTWLTKLNQGTARKSILSGFIYSTEFKSLCSQFGIKAYENTADDGNWESLGTFKITFYCPCATCNGNSSGLTASGKELSVGTTAAVSRSYIKLGTTIKIDGIGIREAQDTGVAGKTIDVLVSSHAEAYRLGVMYKEVWIKR